MQQLRGVWDSKHLQLKPATQAVVAELVEIEKALGSRGFVGHDSEDKHLSYLTNNDVAYWVITPKNKQLMIGYVILQGLKGTLRNGSVELKRIALTERNQGYGQEIIELIKDISFNHLEAHRLWLAVFDNNDRAIHVYKREGFSVEGTLRECVRVEDDFASLVILSMLEPEYRAAS